MPRLYQDAAGTIPAVLPGQSVGLIQRAAGTADLSQATVAARPTLARRPKGGRRNLLVATEALQHGVAWNNAMADQTSVLVSGGIYGIAAPADHRQYAVYDRTNGAFIVPRTAWPISDGRFSVTFTVPAGCTEANIYPATKDGTSQVYTQAENSVVVPGQTYTFSMHVHDGKVGGIQRELGSTMTPYQKVVSANDITEAGVDDIWHLFFDGVDDALGVTLPAGTYGRARVSELGVVTVDSVTNPTSLTFGAATRVADFMLRQGAFSSAEIAALTSYWEGIYK